MDAFVSNISQGGLSLHCPHADNEGTEGEVLITLPGQQKRMKLKGEVMWCERSSRNPEMGFRFSTLPREQRLALANFLIARYYSG